MGCARGWCSSSVWVHALLSDIPGALVAVVAVVPQVEVVRGHRRSFQLLQGVADHRLPPPDMVLLLRGGWARRPPLRRYPRILLLDGLPSGCATPAPLQLGFARSCSFSFLLVMSFVSKGLQIGCAVRSVTEWCGKLVGVPSVVVRAHNLTN